MTKRLFLFAGLVVLPSAILAQSFSDGFEGAVYSGAQFTTGNTAGDTITSVVVWDAINRSNPLGISGWSDGVATGVPWTAHGGTTWTSANFNNTAGVGTIDNWIIAPVRLFNNGDTISFWTRTVTTVTFPDRLRLRLSTNGSSTAAADFSTVLVDVNPNLTLAGYPSTWTQFTATLSGLSGPTSGRFAFAYQVPQGGPNGANSDYIGIDDVSYTVVPEPATIAALGLGAVALLRRRRRN